jgi:hypothetical protein
VKIWIVTGNTESGDEIVPLAFNYGPTREEVTKVLKEKFSEEFDEFGAQIYFSIDEVAVIE